MFGTSFTSSFVDWYQFLMIVYPLHIDHDNNHLNIVTLDVIEAHSYILLVFENDTHC